jgi:hypothetical protein
MSTVECAADLLRVTPQFTKSFAGGKLAIARSSILLGEKSNLCQLQSQVKKIVER